MKILLLILIVLILTGCPTPFGILYGDQIIHWDGEVESIEDWIDGDDDDTTDVTIIVEWPWDD
jgi:outer membrane biogenesis lipoprotein LolB